MKLKDNSKWNIWLMGYIGGRLSIAMSAPSISRAVVAHKLGAMPIASVGYGFDTEEKAREYMVGDDGGGGLVFDRLYVLTIDVEVEVDVE